MPMADKLVKKQGDDTKNSFKDVVATISNICFWLNIIFYGCLLASLSAKLIIRFNTISL